MKKFIFFALLIVITAGLSAQTTYQYVIIPTQFPDIGNGFNPYGLSSGIQKVLNEKSIKNSFQTDDFPEDYCEALTVNLVNESSMFKHRLRVELKDCRNKTIWEGEGTGSSKAFNEGLPEAFADAVKDLNELPPNTTVPVTTVPAVAASKPEVRLPVIEQTQDGDIYRPGNLYYNYKYFVDLVEGEGGSKNLLVLNGELLGYDNLQNIATLKLSGIGDVYTVNWARPDGSVVTGVANLTGKELKISIPNGQNTMVITLQKY
jgi:hypothetical protein